MSTRIAMKWSSTVLAFRLLYVAFIIVASAATFVSAWTAAHATEHPAFPSPTSLAALAAIEIAAAVLFIFRSVELPAATILLVVFGVAEVLSVMNGEASLRFIFYAGTVLFILAAARRE